MAACAAVHLRFARAIIAQDRAPRQDGDKQLSRKHDFVRATLAHHGINNVHTALVADLVHGLDDLRQAGQKPDTVQPLTDAETLHQDKQESTKQSLGLHAL
tara:strand:+ start:127 stop:429 length:303 start_codon:yes stop_codon:yes gene_type:complete